MAVVTAFLVNLLCSIVSCDPKLPTPEIRGRDLFGQQQTASSSIFQQTSGISSSFINLNLNSIELDPVVATKYGQIRGYGMRTAENRKIYAFQGVPYAIAKRFEVNNFKIVVFLKKIK